MSQHDMNLANQAGAAFRADANLALAALVGLSNGASAPGTTFAYMFWADTTANLLKRRNAANSGWEVVCTLSESFVVSRSSNTILVGSDIGRFFIATSSFTQTLTAAATLGDGWYCYYRNDGSGTITFDPDGSETIAGATTYALRPGESCVIVCNGSGFYLLNISRYAGVQGAAKNLFVNLSSSAAIAITADELQLKDTSGNVFVATSVSVTPSLAASGANGLDTGAEASGTWYYGWVIAKPDGTVAGLFSTSSSAPTMPSGYTFKALVGAYRNDGSSNLLNFNQFGNEVFYLAAQSLLSAGSATTETSVSTATLVPPNAAAVRISYMGTLTLNGSGLGQGDVALRWVSGSAWHVHTFVEVVSAAASGVPVVQLSEAVLPNNSQALLYLWTITAGSAPALDINVLGFKLKGVGGE